MRKKTTRVIRIEQERGSSAQLREAAGALREGALVAFPTETVYGLGANALDDSAVRKIFEAKRRPLADPLIVHVANSSMMSPLVCSSPEALSRLASFWPGPLTLVLSKSGLVPPEVTAGLDSVAIRVPAHPVALALIEAAGVPVAAPSANRFSRPSPTCAAHVLEDLDGRIDVLLDAGPTRHGIESTVVDLTGPVPRLLRPGVVTVEQLRKAIPQLEVPSSLLTGLDATGSKSPGTQLKHYAPRARVLLFAGEERARVLGSMKRRVVELLRSGARVGVMLPGPDLDAFHDLPGQGFQSAMGGHLEDLRLGESGALEEIASGLYAAMRELDSRGVEFVVCAGFSDRGLGRTLQDRLVRAAEGRVVRLDGDAREG